MISAYVGTCEARTNDFDATCLIRSSRIAHRASILATAAWTATRGARPGRAQPATYRSATATTNHQPPSWSTSR